MATCKLGLVAIQSQSGYKTVANRVKTHYKNEFGWHHTCNIYKKSNLINLVIKFKRMSIVEKDRNEIKEKDYKSVIKIAALFE